MLGNFLEHQPLPFNLLGNVRECSPLSFILLVFCCCQHLPFVLLGHVVKTPPPSLLKTVFFSWSPGPPPGDPPGASQGLPAPPRPSRRPFWSFPAPPRVSCSLQETFLESARTSQGLLKPPRNQILIQHLKHQAPDTTPLIQAF